MAGARIVIDPTNLRVGAGRVALRGALDPAASDMQIDIAGLPLTLIDTFAPGTGLEGTLQAKVRATGAMAAPRLEASYTATGVRVRRPDAALIPSLSLQGTGSLVGQQASLDARLAAGGNTNLSIKGTATLPRGAGPVAAKIALGGSIDIAPFAPLLGNDIRNVTGRLRPELSITVNGTQISGTGAVDFEGGAVAMPDAGLKLSNGQGRLVLQGDTLQVQRLTFQAGAGTVNGSGSMRFDAERGLVLDIGLADATRLAGQPARHGGDRLQHAQDHRRHVLGHRDFGTGHDRPGGDFGRRRPDRVVPDHRGARDQQAGRRRRGDPADAGQEAHEEGPSPTATPIKLALDVRAPQAVFVRGRGLDAEMSGQTHRRRQSDRARGHRRLHHAARHLQPGRPAPHLLQGHRHARQSGLDRSAARLPGDHDGPVVHDRRRHHRDGP